MEPYLLAVVVYPVRGKEGLPESEGLKKSGELVVNIM